MESTTTPDGSVGDSSLMICCTSVTGSKTIPGPSEPGEVYGASIDPHAQRSLFFVDGPSIPGCKISPAGVSEWSNTIGLGPVCPMNTADIMINKILFITNAPQSNQSIGTSNN